MNPLIEYIRFFVLSTLLTCCLLPRIEAGPVRGGLDLRQEKTVPSSAQTGQTDGNSASLIFDAIESAVLSGDVKKFSSHFGKQIQINIVGVANGYYSANQAFYILQNYFSARKFQSFKFTSRKVEAELPFATGGGTSRVRGVSALVQVYVSLDASGGRWVIHQFSIY